MIIAHAHNKLSNDDIRLQLRQDTDTTEVIGTPAPGQSSSNEDSAMLHLPMQLAFIACSSISMTIVKHATLTSPLFDFIGTAIGYIEK